MQLQHKPSNENSLFQKYHSILFPQMINLLAWSPPPPSSSEFPMNIHGSRVKDVFFLWGTILGIAFCFLLLLLLVLIPESLKWYSTLTIWGTMNGMNNLSFLIWNGCFFVVVSWFIFKSFLSFPFCLFSLHRRPEKCAYGQESMCTCIKQNEPQHQI